MKRTTTRLVMRWCAVVLSLVLFVSLRTARAQGSSSNDVAEPFRDYYATHDGIRLLGDLLTDAARSPGQC